MFESLTASLQKVFSRWGRDRQLTPANIRSGLEEIRNALLEADVHFQVTRELVEEVTRRAVGSTALESVRPADQVIKIFSDVLTESMKGEAPRLTALDGKPAVVMMVGLQGSGKTTTSAKLALRCQRSGRRPLLVAADVRRPAAIEQLRVLGQKLSIEVHSEPDVAPQEICAGAVERARRSGHDVVILDTAGRLHIDEPLMEELEVIAERVRPDVTYLVCDAMAGQDAYTSAREFHGRLRLDALILTKLDGDTRGGSAISVRRVTGKPVAFLGTGERLEDLDEFHAERMASRILGMGDVVTLVEKAQQAFEEKEAEEAAQKLLRAEFNFQDFLQQMRALRRMGPLSGLLKLLPGGLGQAFEQAGSHEDELGRVEAAVLSMTEEERLEPDRIDASRKRRIAKGSGNDLSAVNQLLRRFEQMRQMMKQLGGSGMLGGLGRMMGGGLGGLSGSQDPGRVSTADLASLQRRNAPAAAIDRDALRRERKRQKEARRKNRRRR